MITWHDPKNKLPEIDDAIVVYRIVNSGETIEFSVVEIINYWEPSDFEEITKVGDVFYWAYAKDFNFPKDE